MSAQNGATFKGCAFRDSALTANRDALVHRWVPWVAGYYKGYQAVPVRDRYDPAFLEQLVGVEHPTCQGVVPGEG